MNPKKLLFLVSTLVLFTLGCNLLALQASERSLTPSPSEAPAMGSPSPHTPVSERRCGDAVCDGPENAANCPDDCTSESAPADLPQDSALLPSKDTNTYWVINPTNDAKLFVRALYPGNWSGETLPTLVLVPAGTGTIEPAKARRIVESGFIVVSFDPDGRGDSEGEENLNGHIHQDGLAAVVQATPSIPGVDQNRIGLVSFSYGITMASGALARYPDLPVKFLIDWEGPADRYDTTVECQPNPHIDFPDCSDEAAWSEREALTFIAQIHVPYQRLQSEKDHVQPDVSHAINMVNSAVQGGVPWVRLNELLPNQTYDPANPPAMLPEKANATIEDLIASLAPELFSLSP